MYTLGINAAFHDSAACLVRDGDVLAAAEEERFTRIKHAKRPVPFSAYELPYHAIAYCLERAGIGLDAVDHVAYSYDPYQRLGKEPPATLSLPLAPSAVATAPAWESPWEPLFLAYIVNAPRQLRDGAPHHLRRWFGPQAARHEYRWHFVDHHLAHEASAFFPSPFEHAAVLTMDGRGERATTTHAIGAGARLARLGQVDYPHSLGLLYEEVTEYLGFLRSSDEYKIMALASFGEPRYLTAFQDIVRRDGQGGYRVGDLQLIERFGPARRPGEPVERHHRDLACSLQRVLEETVLELAAWLHEASGEERLCMAGGVALNCVLNGRLQREGPFQRMWVQPAAGDAGTALGAALWIDARERGLGSASMEHVFLGPEYGDREIEGALQRAKLRYRRVPDVAAETAALLAQDKIVGWFQGGMEFGPRALGGRSILASPLNPAMQARLNELKDREDFRPVAPVVLEEEAPFWFEGCTASPFMLFVYPVMPEQGERIPAALHVDGTARVQTINRVQHACYYDLLRAFRARTGVPVLINTSFNTRGGPIVCTPRDAIECFAGSPLDALVIGSYVVEKQGAFA